MKNNNPSEIKRPFFRLFTFGKKFSGQDLQAIFDTISKFREDSRRELTSEITLWQYERRISIDWFSLPNLLNQNEVQDELDFLSDPKAARRMSVTIRLSVCRYTSIMHLER
jgi:hypothetical protein